MKLSRRRLLLAGCALAAGAVLSRADVPRWLVHLEMGTLQDAFFQTLSWPGGAVRVPRTPTGTRSALSSLIASNPNARDLYRLRASQDELLLDFTAAEADWKRYAEGSGSEGQLALAEYYHRRVRPEEEWAALKAAASEPSPASERFLPAAAGSAWQTYARMLELTTSAQLGEAKAAETFAAWIAHYPGEAEPYRLAIDYLRQHRMYDDAGRHIEEYAKAFPSDTVYPFTARAEIEAARGNTASALGLYEREFQPSWPQPLVAAYFDLLERTGKLRPYLTSARAEAARDPGSLNAAAKIFFSLRKLGNDAGARRALTEFRLHKEQARASWNPKELATLASLFAGVHDAAETIRHDYALHNLPAATAADREEALSGIANELLDSGGQPLRFGADGLSFFRDIGTMDPYPGYLNGILSLLLNSVSPSDEMGNQERNATAYFQRARASELVSLFDKQFPNSPRRAELHARVIHSYGIYREGGAVLKAGREFLAAFPNAPQRVAVQLEMADAYAAAKREKEEFAIYDAVLKELGERAQGVPLGQAMARSLPAPQAQAAADSQDDAGDNEESGDEPRNTRAIPAARPQGEEAGTRFIAGPQTARSPEYARVLDRYVSRLAALKRVSEAAAVWLQEIQRNPDDPGLYERMAAFLEQNQLGSRIESVYRNALARFQDASWTSKLARWYLRRERRTEFRNLTEDFIKAAKGTDLEAYFHELVTATSLGPAAYKQVNLYAHQRFPNNLQFVRNLISAYGRKETADPAAARSLLREYWIWDDGLRQEFFSRYAAEEATEAAAVAGAARGAEQVAQSSPAAARLAGELAIWRSHFEEATPYMEALAAQQPGDVRLAMRAASLERSLSYTQPERAAKAVAILDKSIQYDPRSREAITAAGEILADGERFADARAWWNRLAAMEPGKPDGYLEAATVFWDYFQYDDALRLIGEGRTKLAKSELWAYEAGAIHENKGEWEAAIREYVRGASTLAKRHGGDEPGQTPARSRLLRLARRANLKPLIESATMAPLAGPRPDPAAVALRVAVLDRQGRKTEIEPLLVGLARGAGEADLLDAVSAAANAYPLDSVQQAVAERRVALASDEIERVKQQLGLARFLENKPDIAAARAVIEQARRSSPTLLGVVRAAVDFYTRNHMPGEAIATLEAAASVSSPSYSKSFTFEAAQTALDAAEWRRARTLLERLLEGEPYEVPYLAAVARSYAGERDGRGLRDFCAARIAAMQHAPFDAATRGARTAELRRGLIEPLETLGQHQDAVTQFIALIRAAPDDEALVAQSAQYAAKHGLGAALLAAFSRAASESPKDPKPQIAVARIEAHYENYPAAVAAYEHAVELRPARLDLRTAEAGLLERLMRFADAEAVYRKLYAVTYHDSQWLVKAAEMQARQAKNADAAATLRTALIDGRPERAEHYFEVAALMERWGMVEEAAQAAARGADLAGDKLLAGYREQAILYARLMTRLRKHEEAVARIATTLRGPSLGEQANSDPWLMGVLLRPVGDTAAKYFTPEELTALGSYLARQRSTRGNTAAWNDALLAVAQAAGLKEREAQWRTNAVLSAAQSGEAPASARQVAELQGPRLQQASIASLYERLWLARNDRKDHMDLLATAAKAYREAGDAKAEMRVLALNPDAQMGRYLDLLKTLDPQRRVTVAASSAAGLAAAIESGDAAFVKQVFAVTPPTGVERRQLAALAGLYVRDASPEADNAFRSLLGTRVIGEQLGKSIDRAQQPAGDEWLTLASRYGEYLASLNKDGAEDYFEALVELRPADAASYFTLASSYSEYGMRERAIEEYGLGLQLKPNAGERQDAIARLREAEGKHGEAVARWKMALEAYRRTENAGIAPPDFWQNVEGTLTAIGKARALAEVRPEADALLRDYIHVNGGYSVNPLLRGALAASASPEDGVRWILALAGAAREPEMEEACVEASESMVSGNAKELVLRRLMELARARVQQAGANSRSFAEGTLGSRQTDLIEFLVANGRTAEAKALLAQVRAPRPATEALVAAKAGSIDSLLTLYKNDEAHAPHAQTLIEAAAALTSAGEEAAARALLDYVYSREIARRDFSPESFLGWAKVKIDSGDKAGAVALLKRMALIEPNAFESLLAAGDLLERSGMASEAAEMYEARVKAVPWDHAAAVKLARVRRNAEALARAASSSMAEYSVRVEGAKALSALKPGTAVEGGELALLAGKAGDVEKPLYFAARVRAAGEAKDAAARVRLLRGAIAIRPGEPETRVALIQAALDAGNPRLALTAAGPFVAALHDSGEGDEGPIQEWVRNSRAQFLSDGGLTPAQRAKLAMRLGDAARREGELAEAKTLFESAEIIAPGKESAAKLASLQGEIKRRAENRERVPLTAENATQQIVRPMIKEVSQ